MTETDRSDTETRTSSAGKTQRCFLREHLVHGSDPEHLTFILRHRTHLASVVSLGFNGISHHLRLQAFLGFHFVHRRHPGV
jgi:hypothetical protein